MTIDLASVTLGLKILSGLYISETVRYKLILGRDIWDIGVQCLGVTLILTLKFDLSVVTLICRILSETVRYRMLTLCRDND